MRVKWAIILFTTCFVICSIQKQFNAWPSLASTSATEEKKGVSSAGPIS